MDAMIRSARARARGAGRWIYGVAVTLGMFACGQEVPSTSATAGAVSRPAVGSAADPANTVTLITGDRVTLTPGSGLPTVHVEPGPGRAQIGFVTLRLGDEVTVIPKDVAPLVGANRVDRALFNITRLLADGFGDRDRDDLPMIITGDDARAAPLAPGGLVIGRVIPALHATAVRQPKSNPGAALAMIQPITAAARTTGPAPKLWLDRHRRMTLDHSVPQIGGPAAWARGATGAGAVIAVLDSGIDASHPDLAGAVIDAQSFVDDGLGTSDVFGHATHVASIIAGSGAASDGLYRGVAPDAKLLSGRVCGPAFCDDSAILAGMAWAVVDQHAPIVNMSLGGFDEPGLDPLEEAVNQLSAQYGTLFVISAGNFGILGAGFVGSPGSAEAALTVGAVDRDDALAPFSSRGPLPDGSIKPDVTAPGVDIVAARATTVAPIGEPVGTAYQRLSGTSMAAPHVAGAAALLLQQHPDWAGPELKAALTGSALANPALTVFEQGAGRIDVDRATRQHVIAEPSSVSLGLAVWPHTDDPVLVRAVTYRNDATAPITLALTANLALPDHGAAPPGLIRVEPAMLTVPAGGSADAVVTVDTNGDGPDGVYTGAVVATAGDTRIATAVTVEREVESHELTLRVINRAGEPAAAFVALIERSATAQLTTANVDGALTLRLPRATYAVHAFPDEPVYLVYPRLTLDHDVAITLDARLAKPADVTLTGVPLAFGNIGAGTWDLPARAEVRTSAPQQLFTAQLGPDALADEFRSWIVAAAVRSGAPIDDPDRYAFAHQERGRMVTGWQETVSPRQLATVEASNRGESHSTFRRFLHIVLDDTPEIGSVTEADLFDQPGAAHRTEHVFGPGFRWGTQLAQLEPIPVVPEFLFAVGETLAVRRYLPGQHYVERWNHAPFGPALAEAFLGPPAARIGDQLTIAPSMFSDQALPSRASWSAWTHQRATLFRNDSVLTDHIDEHEFWFPTVDVPPGDATYRFEQDSTRGPNLLDGSPLFDLSTHVTAAWTFRSQHVAGDTPAILPLPTLRFLPELDADDRAPGRALVLPVVVERPQRAATPAIARITIDVSFDDGKTWSPVPGLRFGDRWLGVVLHPPHAAYASLRGSVRDAVGNHSELTIIHAYRLAGT